MICVHYAILINQIQIRNQMKHLRSKLESLDFEFNTSKTEFRNTYGSITYKVKLNKNHFKLYRTTYPNNKFIGLFDKFTYDNYLSDGRFNTFLNLFE